MNVNITRAFLVVAVVLFVLVGFEVEPKALDDVSLLGFGLAFGFAAFLVG